MNVLHTMEWRPLFPSDLKGPGDLTRRDLGPRRPPPAPARTIVIGLGNPILGDDGVGWRVVEAVQQAYGRRAPAPPVEFEYLSVGGLTLMEHLIGYEKAVLVDAINSGEFPQGAVATFPLDELPNRAAGHLTSAHDTTLHNALDVGRRMGASLPEQVLVVAVEAQFVYDFSEQLSPPVAAAVPRAAETVLALLAGPDI